MLLQFFSTSLSSYWLVANGINLHLLSSERKSTAGVDYLMAASNSFELLEIYARVTPGLKDFRETLISWYKNCFFLLVSSFHHLASALWGSLNCFQTEKKSSSMKYSDKCNLQIVYQ